jgi:hypothetical protein
MDLTETKTVAIHMDKKIWKRFCRMAIDEEIPLYLLINESLAGWLKWIRKLEYEELMEAKKCDAKELKTYQKESLETQRLIEKYRREKIAYKMKMEAKDRAQTERKAYFRGSYKKKGMLA